ncbi:uncharacterized protein [Dermacentor albipictus]|uniref:uncharacterized protein n=1 Tax=Dermacentor albipictus TaxID=60249 RepID=UPI0038FC4E37
MCSCGSFPRRRQGRLRSISPSRSCTRTKGPGVRTVFTRTGLRVMALMEMMTIMLLMLRRRHHGLPRKSASATECSTPRSRNCATLPQVAGCRSGYEGAPARPNTHRFSRATVQHYLKSQVAAVATEVRQRGRTLDGSVAQLCNTTSSHLVAALLKETLGRGDNPGDNLYEPVYSEGCSGSWSSARTTSRRRC